MKGMNLLVLLMSSPKSKDIQLSMRSDRKMNKLSHFRSWTKRMLDFFSWKLTTTINDLNSSIIVFSVNLPITYLTNCFSSKHIHPHIQLAILWFPLMREDRKIFLALGCVCTSHWTHKKQRLPPMFYSITAQQKTELPLLATFKTQTTLSRIIGLMSFLSFPVIGWAFKSSLYTWQTTV